MTNLVVQLKKAIKKKDFLLKAEIKFLLSDNNQKSIIFDCPNFSLFSVLISSLFTIFLNNCYTFKK